MLNPFRFRHLFVAVLLVSCTNAAYSEQYASIYLKSGDRITGRWLGSDSQAARINFHNQELSIPLDDVNAIRFGDNLSLIPDADAEKHFRNGEALLELGLREEAKQKFRAAIEAFPKFADAHFKLGTLLQEEGNIDEAVKYFGYVAKINPEAYNLAMQLKGVGDTYLTAEEYRKASQTYLLLFNYYPTHLDAEYVGYTAGFLLAEQLEANEEALQVLQRAKRRFPTSLYLEKTDYVIGLLHSKMGQFETAVTILSEFIINYRESELLDDAYLARGEAHLLSKRNLEAIADFDHAIEITQDGKLRSEARKRRDACVWTVYRVSDGLPSNQIEAIVIDGDTLWIGTPKGLAQVDVSISAESWRLIADGVDLINTMFDGAINVRTLAVDDAELWIGTLNHGVIRYDTFTRIPENYDTSGGFPHNQVNDIKILGDEVWIATFSGVVRFNRSKDEWAVFDKRNDGLPADDITALAVTSKAVWIGTSGHGIALYDRGLGSWRDFGLSDGLNLSAGSSITCFDVWRDRPFATWYNEQSNGYAEIDQQGFNSPVQPVDAVGDLVSLRDIYIAVGEISGENAGETEKPPPLWLAKNDVVYLHNAGNWEPFEFPAVQLGNPIVNCITLGDDVVWVGTSNGLAKLDRNTFVSDEQIQNEEE
jgi:tetratricopeptide (TPR) repeat protein